MPTFFAKCDHFEPVPDDGHVLVVPFLKAARHFPVFFDALGTAFKPIKGDISGNIDKLNAKYETDPKKFTTFRAICVEEMASDDSSSKESASCALLWLKRGLQYISIFMKEIIDDHEKGKKTENMVPHVQKAYEESLKMYHGWIIQKVFGVVAHAAPYRKDFLKTLADGQDGKDDEVIADMKSYLEVFEPNVANIHALLVELNLDNPEKV